MILSSLKALYSGIFDQALTDLIRPAEILLEGFQRRR